MYALQLSALAQSEKTLTQGVLQAGQFMGLYHAEIARLLGLQCDDIGRLSNAQAVLSKQSDAWYKAIQLIELYTLLYSHCEADEGKMHNWLRRIHPALNERIAPLYLMLDYQGIDQVIGYLNSNK